jgi:hypothetical protein
MLYFFQAFENRATNLLMMVYFQHLDLNALRPS